MPEFYIDNVNVFRNQTKMVNGNTVSDLEGHNVIGIDLNNINTVRAKENKCLRIRSRTGTATGIKITNCEDVLLIYNISSRCGLGFDFSNITNLHVYNLTSHNCDICVRSDSNSIFRNIVLSAYEDWNGYNTNIGFYLIGGALLNIDYILYNGIGDIYQGGNITEGNTIYNTLPMYKLFVSKPILHTMLQHSLIVKAYYVSQLYQHIGSNIEQRN